MIVEPNDQVVQPEGIEPELSLDEFLAAHPVVERAAPKTGQDVMLQALLDAGKLTPEQAAAMRDVEDGEPVTATQSVRPDWNSLPPEMSAPAQVAEYRLPNNTAIAPTFEERQLAGDAFLTANLPTTIAQSLFHRMSQVASQRLTPDQVELMSRETTAKMHLQYGDRADAMIAKARTLIQQVAVKHPGVIDALVNSGAGSDYMIVRQMAEHANRLLK